MENTLAFLQQRKKKEKGKAGAKERGEKNIFNYGTLFWLLWDRCSGVADSNALCV
jgi:hypothetical protein